MKGKRGGGRFLEGLLVVKSGDITLERTDVIVNAANKELMGGGGVDGAIHRAGGSGILEECQRIRREEYPGGLSVGGVVMTLGGKLKAKYVFHTVGPKWKGGGYGEEEDLRRCYQNCLRLGEEKGIERITFPSISTGVYGYPKEKAWEVSARSVKDWLEGGGVMKEVVFIFFEKKDEMGFIERGEGILY